MNELLSLGGNLGAGGTHFPSKQGAAAPGSINPRVNSRSGILPAGHRRQGQSRTGSNRPHAEGLFQSDVDNRGSDHGGVWARVTLPKRGFKNSASI